jgi:hypothetical protein
MFKFAMASAELRNHVPPAAPTSAGGASAEKKPVAVKALTLLES